MCGTKGHIARDGWSRANQDRTVHVVEGAKVDSDAAKEFLLTIENILRHGGLSQSGCEGHEDSLVMIDSGASVKTDQCNSEVRTEEHSKTSKTPDGQSATFRVQCLGFSVFPDLN